ncbi:MAG: hypothetical protein ACRD36_11730 [Candidatus Acidiferrum sp.]
MNNVIPGDETVIFAGAADPAHAALVAPAIAQGASCWQLPGP